MEKHSTVILPHLPLTEAGVTAFLASDHVAGIGPAYAKRLVKEFGTDALRVFTEEPEKITGIGEARVKGASESIRDIQYPVEMVAFLFSCGVSDMYIERIFGKYRKRTPGIILADPYSMVEDVWQLSFFTADKIGRGLAIAPDDPRRLQGALVTAVKHFAEAGHLFATPEDAVAYASVITGVDPVKVQEAVESVVESSRLVLSRGGLYLPVFYKAEKEGAGKLMALARTDLPTPASDPLPLPPPEPLPKADSESFPMVDREGHRYSKMQLEAIKTVLNSPVAVLTGGPGTGKTTVLRGVIEALEKMGKKVVLAAPTGRAAKRMTTLTGVEASTIHRLLGYTQGQGYHSKAIEADVLIIDEGSMMEQVLFNHLLQAIRPGTRVILVGDVDQLPAIGAGDVLRDMIDSGVIPVARLNENFRQGEGSMIAESARAINAGELPHSDPERDFMIIPESTPKRIHARLLSLVSKEIPAAKGISPSDIRVVTPQQIGPLGARQLNIDLQNLLNPVGPELRRGATVMRLGDPVMQTANSKDRKIFHTSSVVSLSDSDSGELLQSHASISDSGEPLQSSASISDSDEIETIKTNNKENGKIEQGRIYNGEIGKIVEVNTEEHTLTVEFSDGRRSIYHRSELSELVLAYATTVHKLQGSEEKYIVIPLTMAHKPMLYRNLLYTGVSRATRLCVLVGEEEALRYAVSHTPTSTRNSNFKHRLAAHTATPATPTPTASVSTTSES